MASETTETVWHPADMFSTMQVMHKNYALVVLNQPLRQNPLFYARIWSRSLYHIGADGGANQVYDLIEAAKEISVHSAQVPIRLDTVIGDFDSVRPEVQEYWTQNGSEIIHDTDEYSTDFTKAIRYISSFKVSPTGTLKTSISAECRQRVQAIKDGPRMSDIVVLGGLGGRVDQGMSTLHQLYSFQLERAYELGRMFLISTESITFVLKTGRHRIRVKPDSDANMKLGKHIGIIPLKEPSVITTKGLEWDVTNWPTAFGGQISTSNHVKEEWVTIETTKDVLFTIDFDLDLDALKS